MKWPKSKRKKLGMKKFCKKYLVYIINLFIFAM